MGGSSKPAGSTTTSTEPWGGVDQFLENLYFRVGGPLSSSDPTRTNVGGLIDQPIPVQDPIAFTAPELQAQQRLMEVGQAELPPIYDATAGQLGRTIEGGYLGANPHLDAMFEASARPVRESFMEETLPALTGQFAAAGRQGGGAHESVARDATEDLNRVLSDMSAGLYGGAYESERDRQMQAMRMAPAIGAAPGRYQAWQAGLMGDVGQAQRELLEARNVAESARAREPWERLQMAAQLYGAGSPFTTTSQPYYQNKLAGALGGAATGAGLGSMFGPWGAGIGGLGGLLLGGVF